MSACIYSFGQHRNTEFGLSIFSIISQNSGLEAKESKYKTTIHNSFSSNSRYFNRYYGKKEIVQNTFTTPTLFVRQRILNNFWIKNVFSYINTTITAIDTFQEHLGTGSTTYFNYYHKQNGLIFSLGPQFQLYNKKRFYVHSGIEVSLYYFRSKLLTEGIGYGCLSVNGTRHNLLLENNHWGLQKIFLTNYIGYALYKSIHIGYEFQTDYQFFNYKPIFTHQFWISKTL